MVERWYVRGVRGAITVKENNSSEIFTATRELLQELMKENQVETEDIASIFFTVTQDLNAEFPALAARELGWRYVPLLCAKEIEVPTSMPKVIRVLMHINTTKKQSEIKHLYLREAAKLRPDLSSNI